MKIFFIKLNFYNMHIKFKIVFKKSSGAFWYFNEASPIPGTHFWKDFTSSQKGRECRKVFKYHCRDMAYHVCISLQF